MCWDKHFQDEMFLEKITTKNVRYLYTWMLVWKTEIDEHLDLFLNIFTKHLTVKCKHTGKGFY